MFEKIHFTKCQNMFQNSQMSRREKSMMKKSFFRVTFFDLMVILKNILFEF